jgi:hypothetical protein
MNCFSTIPYITFLGFTLLLIIGITIFLIRRMNNQNQKFSSIIGVVTTMADELNKIKSFISNGFTSKPSDVKEIHLQNNLIHVSEDEDEEEEEDDDDEDENDDDEEDEDDDDEDDDDEDDDVIKDNIIINEKIDDIKYIQIDAKEDFNSIDISNEENIIVQGSVKEEIPQEVTIQEDTIQEDTIQEDTIQEDTISADTIQEKIDYKKLTLQKLRSIVSKKRLVDDSSKMKKNELLQLLEKE